PCPLAEGGGHPSPVICPCGLSGVFKDGGHDDIRFVVRRFTRAEHCRRVCPRFVVEIAIANEQVDVHPLSSPPLPKPCRLSGKVCVGHLYGPFGLIRADLNELVRVAPQCSSGSSHRAWNRIARTCTLLVRVELPARSNASKFEAHPGNCVGTRGTTFPQLSSTCCREVEGGSSPLWLSAI